MLSELDSEIQKRNQIFRHLIRTILVDKILNPLTNFNLHSKNIHFNKNTHTILPQPFALKSKIGHASKTDTVKVVLYFQAPTIPIPSRKTLTIGLYLAFILRILILMLKNILVKFKRH